MPGRASPRPPSRRPRRSCGPTPPTPRPEAEIRPLLWNIASLKVPEGLRISRGWLRSPFPGWAIVTAIVLFFYVKHGILKM
jgi:hypothetical protein